MKIYCNHYREEGQSSGFAYFATQEEAKIDAQTRRQLLGDEPSQIAGVIDFELTKKGIVRLLNAYASHAEAE